jgi:hypothetical protein
MGGLVLVVDRDEELSVFQDGDSVSNWLEAPDVIDGEFRAFDCAAREYALTAENDAAPVILGPRLRAAPESQLLGRAVSRYLRSMDPSFDTDGNFDADDLCRQLRPFAR